MVSARDAPDPPPLTLRDLHDRPWVSAYGNRSPVMRHLAAIGYEPRVVSVVQDFLAVPVMVTGSSRVAAVPARFAAVCSQHADLRIDPFPVPVPPVVEAFWWHPNHDRDAGHQWFRDQVAAVVVTLREELPAGSLSAAGEA